MKKTTMALAFATHALLAGCAFVQTRADGSQRIVGLLAFETPPAAHGGRVTRWRGLGLVLASDTRGFSSTLGYADSELVLVGRDSCVALTHP